MSADAARKRESHYECCFAGMTNVPVPVIVDNQHVATSFAGQVFLEKPTTKRFHRVVQQLCQWGVETDLASLHEAYLHSRVVGEKEFEAMVRLLRIFAGHLALYAGQCLFRQTDPEPRAVADAKGFALRHCAEHVVMPGAAQHVHLSANYFCKAFKKATGVSFTEHLSRVRVEKAKVLLADVNKRVSEVAFDSGFESIPHFNRVFQALRRHLAHAVSRLAERRCRVGAREQGGWRAPPRHGKTYTPQASYFEVT